MFLRMCADLPWGLVFAAPSSDHTGTTRSLVTTLMSRLGLALSVSAPPLHAGSSFSPLAFHHVPTAWRPPTICQSCLHKKRCMNAFELRLILAMWLAIPQIMCVRGVRMRHAVLPNVGLIACHSAVVGLLHLFTYQCHSKL